VSDTPAGRSRRRRALANRPLRRATAVVGAIVLAGLVYLALRHVHLGAVGHALRTVAPGWIGAAVAVDAVSLLLRALSWRFVLRSALRSPPPPTWAIVRATMVGVMGSAVVPGRVGEAARAWLVARRLPDPTRSLPVVLGTVFAQTIINLVALAILAAVTFSSLSLFNGRAGALAAVIAVPAVVIAVLFAGPRLLAAGRRAPWRRIRDASDWLARQLVRGRQGMRMFRDARDGPPAAFLQLGAWALQTLACYCVILALHLSPPASFLTAAAVLLAVNVTAVVPVSPSNVGIFQAACIAVLAAYGIAAGPGLAYGLVLQAVEVLVAIALGVPALLGEGVKWQQLRRGERVAERAMDEQDG